MSWQNYLQVVENQTAPLSEHIFCPRCNYRLTSNRKDCCIYGIEYARRWQLIDVYNLLLQHGIDDQRLLKQCVAESFIYLDIITDPDYWDDLIAWQANMPAFFN